MSNKDLFALGQKLSVLRHEGVLIIASGQITHDLTGQLIVDDAKAFDTLIAEAIGKQRSEDIVQLDASNPLFRKAHPTMVF